MPFPIPPSEPWRPRPIEEAPTRVSSAVLDQALGSMLKAGERVACAAFVKRVSGPNLRCGMDGSTVSQVAAVTDRRLIKVVAWWASEDPHGLWTAMQEWQYGEVLTTGNLSRRSLWLGQIREIELRTARWPVGNHLALYTEDGGRETIRGAAATLALLHVALRDVRAGPFGQALAPPASPRPVPVGGWLERIAAILRPN
jgi:hypothetical protein